MKRPLHALRQVWVAGSLFAFLLLSAVATGQDPSFSQFYANRIYLNPAFTGLENGIALGASSRLQWLAVDQGFRTYLASVEAPLPLLGLGIGLQVLHNAEGLAALNTNQASLSLSYTIPGEKHNIHFGFQGSLVQKSIDWDALVFTDQLDPAQGIVNPTAIAPVLDRVTYGDFNFGVVWRHDSGRKAGRRGFREVRSHLGLNFNHLPYLVSRSARGNDSFLNLETRVAPRTTFHGGMIIPMRLFANGSRFLAISPNFKVDLQGYEFLNLQENLVVTTLGCYGLISNFYLGLLYQNRFWAPNPIHTDAFILTAGLSANTTGRSDSPPNLLIGLSADINTQGVGPTAGSVIEANIRYLFQTDLRAEGKLRGRGKLSLNGNRSRVLDCKSFF